MESYVTVYVSFGSSLRHEHVYNSLESALKGLRELNAKKPIRIYDIRFGEPKVVKYRKLVKDENGKEIAVPYDVLSRTYHIILLETNGKSYPVSATPGSQWFQVDPYFRGKNCEYFAGYSTIEFFFTRAGTTYKTDLLCRYVNNFSPSTVTHCPVNGYNRIVPILEKVRKEGKLHIHHYNRFSDELVPSMDAE